MSTQSSPNANCWTPNNWSTPVKDKKTHLYFAKKIARTRAKIFCAYQLRAIIPTVLPYLPANWHAKFYSRIKWRDVLFRNLKCAFLPFFTGGSISQRSISSYIQFLRLAPPSRGMLLAYVRSKSQDAVVESKKYYCTHNAPIKINNKSRVEYY